MAAMIIWSHKFPKGAARRSMTCSSSPLLQRRLRLGAVAMRRPRQTFDFCIAALFVLVVACAVAVAVKKNVDRAAARNVFDALVHGTCTHPVVGCRVT